MKATYGPHVPQAAINAARRPRQPHPRLYADRHTAALPHLVVEYLDGPTLDELLDEHGPVDTPEVVALAGRLAATLRWLHRNGVTHGDVKPSNVVIRDGEPVLIDLGSAQPISSMPTGAAAGSPGYAAPEAETDGSTTVATDLYGLGTVLCELLTGKPAFDADVPATARPAPSTLALPAGPLADLARALLDPDPNTRPADAETVLRTLHVTAPGVDTIWPAFLPAPTFLPGGPRNGLASRGIAGRE
jgi:serine/threonine protein kinase